MEYVEDKKEVNMNVRHCLILAVLFLSAIYTPAICQEETVEERLERLEAIVDSLRGLPGEEARVIPDYETIVDTPNVQYGIISIVDRELDKGYFFINHNDDWKIPYWVAYYLSSSNLQGEAKRKGIKFKSDKEIPRGRRAEYKDYTHSGFDRGHLAPAAAFKRSREAIKTTFILSNASPQYHGFNDGIWKRLEKEVREMVTDKGQAWIITGNAFLSVDSLFISPREWIGHLDELNVAVPTHLFKAILALDDDGNFSMYAFLIPNERERNPNPTSDYMIRVDRLEQITGYDFFSELDDSIEDELEGIVGVWAW